MSQRIILAVPLLLLTACVSIGPIKPRFTAATASSANQTDLCEDYYRSQNPAAFSELDRRGVLSAKDREAFATRRAVMGMTSYAARCLYGLPQSINDTTTDTGRTEQWVYCANYMLSPQLRDLGQPSLLSTPESMRTACGSSAYLYFDNGVLVATQNVPVPWQ
jgi:hypothetical protein